MPRTANKVRKSLSHTGVIQVTQFVMAQKERAKSCTFQQFLTLAEQELGYPIPAPAFRTVLQQTDVSLADPRGSGRTTASKSGVRELAICLKELYEALGQTVPEKLIQMCGKKYHAEKPVVPGNNQPPAE